MLLSRGMTVTALVLMWVAIVWVVCDVLFADPDVLVFEDIAILCAVLAPIVYLVGWCVRWLTLRVGNGGAVHRA